MSKLFPESTKKIETDWDIKCVMIMMETTRAQRTTPTMDSAKRKWKEIIVICPSCVDGLSR